jgi:hypothetical protein
MADIESWLMNIDPNVMNSVKRYVPSNGIVPAVVPDALITELSG